MYPTGLRYFKEHEWVKSESDGIALVGITEFAQQQLGDVVFVDLPEVGAELDQFAQIGEIESVKAVNDLFTPVSGAVVEINARLKDAPELVNQEPYGEGWMFRIKLRDPSEVDGLLDAAAYELLVAEEG